MVYDSHLWRKHPAESIVGKGENAAYQHLLFASYFQRSQKIIKSLYDHIFNFVTCLQNAIYGEKHQIQVAKYKCIIMYEMDIFRVQNKPNIAKQSCPEN